MITIKDVRECQFCAALPFFLLLKDENILLEEIMPDKYL